VRVGLQLALPASLVLLEGGRAEPGVQRRGPSPSTPPRRSWAQRSGLRLPTFAEGGYEYGDRLFEYHKGRRGRNGTKKRAVSFEGLQADIMGLRRNLMERREDVGGKIT
jgi:hypothetical protein